MLKRIVQLIMEAGMRSKQDIALTVGVQHETLDDMLDLLTRRGMLRVSDCSISDDSHCSSCNTSAANCTDNTSGRIYYVTEKGKRFAYS
ncbi:MAG: FeoC-like transcriptional regulator [Candidatus Thorarchaeota archaeon]